jgi:hypothetical protein
VFKAIQDARDALDSAGIDINDARNGFWAEESRQLGTQTDAYFEELGRVLGEAKARGPKAVEEALASMRQRVLGTKGPNGKPPEFQFSQK